MTITEGLYLLSRINASWIDCPGNVLCLCPTCCAKLQHGSVESEGILDQISKLKLKKEGGAAELAIELKLCGKECNIKFSERHLIELQELLKSAE